MLRWRKVEVSSGFLLMAALLFYLDTGNLLLWALLSCTLHELGHVLAVRCLGGRVLAFRLTAVGGELMLDRCKPLSYGRELCSILAGPLVNLTVALLCARLGRGETAWVFTGLNLALGCFNLLPVLPLDGGRALAMLLCAWMAPDLAEQVTRVCSGLAVAALTVAAGAAVWGGQGNFTLLFLSLWLTIGLVRKKTGQK